MQRVGADGRGYTLWRCSSKEDSADRALLSNLSVVRLFLRTENSQSAHVPGIERIVAALPQITFDLVVADWNEMLESAERDEMVKRRTKSYFLSLFW